VARTTFHGPTGHQLHIHTGVSRGLSLEAGDFDSVCCELGCLSLLCSCFDRHVNIYLTSIVEKWRSSKIFECPH
jgi:hypothetical protein